MKRIIAFLMIMVLMLSSCTLKKAEMVEVKLYFPDSNVMYLVPEVREIEKGENIEKSVVEEVIKGPCNENLNKAISGEVLVYSAEVKDGVCTIDLSKEFAENNVGGTTKETMAVMSIIASLCALDGIDSVKINIEGDDNAPFGGHFALDEPFSLSWYPDLIKE